MNETGETHMARATLLIVSGAPAAGKTTLATKIGAALGWPMFAKDAIKESLFDTLGYSDREWSRKVGLASVTLLFAIIEREVAAGRSVIAECNFHRGYDMPKFARLIHEYDCSVREVHCTAVPEVIVARFLARWERGERHPGHAQESLQEGELRERLASGAHTPMLAPAHVLTVDTTDFAALDDAALLAAVRALITI